MESVLYSDSPLSQYLEGKGEGDGDVTLEGPGADRDNDELARGDFKFAPSGPQSYSLPTRPRRSPESNSRDHFLWNIARYVKDIHFRPLDLCFGVITDAAFIERFRYTIVASQLLSQHPQRASFKLPPLESESAHHARDLTPSDGSHGSHIITVGGLLITLSTAFGLVAAFKSVEEACLKNFMFVEFAIRMLMLSVLFTAIFVAYRRQRLQNLRFRAVHTVSMLTKSLSDLNSGIASCVTVIQESELVSRGYNVSSPLPPVSRIEGNSTMKGCVHLREAVCSIVASMSECLCLAQQKLRRCADMIDLVKYLDVYDIERSELDSLEENVYEVNITLSACSSIHEIKSAVGRLRVAEKILLCTLLALNASMVTTEWDFTISTILGVHHVCMSHTAELNDIQDNKKELQTSVDSNHEIQVVDVHEKKRIAKLREMLVGLRSIQAKLRFLCEERCLETPDQRTLQRGTSSDQAYYESIGSDLKELLHEWERGRDSVGKSRTSSQAFSRRPSVPLSPTMSLDGTTAFDGSPQEAFQALNGCARPKSRSSASSDGSEEQVLEAVAQPRARSKLSREDRIVKMREQRAEQAMAQQKSQANSHMLRELETVIRLRPTARTTGRVTSPVKNLTSKMLEARLEQANLLKKVVDAIKDLVQDCNFDCNDSGVALQAMDNSHVALVSMMLKAESFSPFRCDRNIALGINLSSLMKVLRCAQNEDILTLKAQDAPDVVNLVFESSESDRLSEYDIKLMDIDQEHLGIPETDYAATITMPSAEFQRICRDLMALSESVAIEATKDGVKFSCSGDIGNGAVTLRSHTNVDKPDNNVDIALSEPVALTFSLKYLVNFCKASGLSSTVKLCLSNEVPLLVEYSLASNSYLRFYLAPKIGDDE